ncbi:Alkaline serine exoprotease A precursor [Actinokineospora spheciospongiae]|uniref:Alkaline serine exoprotease A n=1 Tax=Actinokineospora spheciospongiae TaxID=909613 RepID=W7IGL3_9PSEU|nr:Alkaline serine exoprotease A precursor [Actinokineospora spheciospongiae]
MPRPLTARVNKLLGLGVAVVAGVGVAFAVVPSAAAQGDVLGAGKPGAIKDSYLVVFKEGATRQRPVRDLVGALAGKHRAKVRFTYQATVRGFAGEMTEAEARRLAADPSVERVEQNSVVTTQDTQTGATWGLDRIDQQALPLNGTYTYPNTAGNVRAYVIDTGIRTSHQQFGGRATWGTNTTGDGNDTDCNGHGTHVAGTIGGATHGVAKGVQLTAVKVLDCAGSGSFAQVVAGVDWVTQNHVSGPAVANLSLGGPGTNTTLENAIRASIADGVVYAIAAGNSSTNACNQTPARTAEAITVGATTSTDARASYSNYGTCVDLFAPGSDITSAGSGGDTATAVMSGTSMASPHVAGAAALVLGANPALSPQQVTDNLLGSAVQGRVGNAGTGSPNRFLHTDAITSPSLGDTLAKGKRMNAGQSLRSPDGRYHLDMQSDGNLVLYTQANQAWWHTGTYGNPGAYTVFQEDGNVVLYTSGGRALWATNSWRSAATRLVLQNDSNLVLYGSGGQALWAR